MKKDALVLVFVCLNFALNSQNIYSSDSFINEGIEQRTEEKYDLALESFSKVDKKDPDYSKALYEKFETAILAEKEAEFIEELELAYKNGLFKAYPPLYTLYGNHLSDSEDFEKSEKVFNEGVKAFPNYSNLFLNRAIMYYNNKEIQKSIDNVKTAIIINPAEARAHYFLGVVAAENGYVSESSFALIYYLARFPFDDYAANAIQILNTKMTNLSQERKKINLSKNDDDFSELDEILVNQLPLNRNYKLNCDIDDTYTRQLQAILEYAATHTTKSGFFEQNYVPWMKDVVKNNYTETFIYFSLYSLEGKLGKRLKKKTKEIEKFIEEYYQPRLITLFNKRKVEHFGIVQEVEMFCDDNIPYMVGPTVDGIKQGDYKYYDEYGRTLIIGAYKDDKADGITTYFDVDSNVIEITNFTNGVKNGISTSYYSNGNLQSEVNYLEGELHGDAKYYYILGGMSCKTEFINGKTEGKYICYYQNGTLKTEENYKNDSYDGLQSYYYLNKRKKMDFVYKDGKGNGAFVGYRPDGNIEYKYELKDNILQDSYISYYPNGKMEVEQLRVNGGVIRKEFDLNGKLLLLKDMDSEFNLKSLEYYSPKEQMYFEEKYKKDKLIAAYYYGPNNKKEEINLKKFKFKDSNSKTIVQGIFYKGVKNGDFTYYHLNGNEKIKCNYVKDLNQGNYEMYNLNGSMSYKANLVNDTIIGEAIGYDKFGVLENTYNYDLDGNLDGPFTTYFPNGNIKKEGFYNRGKLTNKVTDYYLDGTIMQHTYYVENEISKSEAFFPDGSESFTIDYGVNGAKQINITNTKKNVSYQLLNGQNNGVYHETNLNGDTLYYIDFLNGVRNGKYHYYSPKGKIRSQLNYLEGLQNGENIYYNEHGEKRSMYIYSNGAELAYYRYYQNGKIQSISENTEQIKEAKKLYFNHDGDTILIAYYDDEVMTKYQTRMNSSEFSPPILIPRGEFTIESKNDKGVLLFKAQLKDNLYDGKFSIYNNDGQLVYESDNKDGGLNGLRKEYYSNGQLYMKEQFTNNRYEGLTEFFDQDGKNILQANYKYDMLHGDYNIFENGTLITTKQFNSDVEIR